MHGSVARVTAKRNALQAKQVALAAYIGTGPYNALTAAQQANLQAQNTIAIGRVTQLTARIQRKTGHS